MKKTTKLKYGKFALQELTIQGSKTYFQITKGKQKLATFIEEEEANESFDHIVMHGNLNNALISKKSESKPASRSINSDIKNEQVKTYSSKDGYDIVISDDEFEVYDEEGELVLEGDSPTDNPKRLYQMLKRNGDI